MTLCQVLEVKIQGFFSSLVEPSTVEIEGKESILQRNCTFVIVQSTAKVLISALYFFIIIPSPSTCNGYV